MVLFLGAIQIPTYIILSELFNCRIAPLALFHTELMNLSGSIKSARTQAVTKALIDPEDCFDSVYLRETGLTVSFVLEKVALINR